MTSACRKSFIANGFHDGNLYIRQLLPRVDSMDWRLLNNFRRVWLKHGHILPGVFLIQIAVPLFPSREAATKIDDVFKASRFQIIRRNVRKSPSRPIHQNMLIPRDLPQIFFDRDTRRLVGIRQTLEFFPVNWRTDVQDIGLFIE